MTWTYTHAITVAADRARVFDALAIDGELEAWFAERASVELVVGGSYRFWGRFTLGVPTAAQATQRLIGINPGRELVVQWTIAGCPTQFAVNLSSVPGGTQVHVAHLVDGDLGVLRQRELIDDFWRLSLGNLASYLSGGEGLVRPDMTDPAPEIRLTIDIAAPPEKVFRFLVEPELVRRWAGGNPAIEPRIGGAVDLGWRYQVDGRTVRGGPTRILELVPPVRLVLDWSDWRGDDSVTGQFIVFDLEPTPSGTRLHFRHAGFTRATDLSDYPFGWNHFLKEIAQHACIV